MTHCTVYYDPDCSKCRALLGLLEARGIAAHLVDYRRDPPDAADLTRLIARLGVEASALLRSGESEFALLNDAEREPGPDRILAALQRFPQLMQRPVVIRGERAVIARPPERVLELFEDPPP